MSDFSDWSESPGLLSVPQGDLSEAMYYLRSMGESHIWYVKNQPKTISPKT